MTAHTPNLPALIAALPGDDTRAPQTEFTRGCQVRFLENLSLTGSVRSAAAVGGVSHQTAYRARRGQPPFRLAWDAALLAARAAVERDSPPSAFQATTSLRAGRIVVELAFVRLRLQRLAGTDARDFGAPSSTSRRCPGSSPGR